MILARAAVTAKDMLRVGQLKMPLCIVFCVLVHVQIENLFTVRYPNFFQLILICLMNCFISMIDCYFITSSIITIIIIVDLCMFIR